MATSAPRARARSRSNPSSSSGAAASQTERGKPRSKQEAIDRLNAAARVLAAQMPLAQLGTLAVETEQAAGAASASAGVSALTGEPLPSVAQLHQARVSNLKRAFAQRRELLADAITVAEVAELLGVGRQTPHDRIRSQALVAVKDRGQWRMPLWQFDPEGPDGVLAGLPETLQALRGPISELGRVRWFVTPKARLEGRTPVDALHSGDVEDVIATAAELGAS